jgi:hypothetical protein
MRHRLIATTLGAIACVIACLTTGIAGGGSGTASPGSHFATFASSPPTSSSLTVVNTGSCPATGTYLWCNATGLVPNVGTSTWVDELGIINPAQAAPLGGHTGAIQVTGSYSTLGVALRPGGHTASATWTESLAYSGLVSVYASSPCAPRYSAIWLNLSASVDVYNAVGTLLGSLTVPTTIVSAAATTATSCANHVYFVSGYSGSTPLAVPFTLAAATTVHMVTAVELTATVRFTQDSCAIFGANWGYAGPWSWGVPSYCPPIGTLTAPPLPPPSPNTGIVLTAPTIT